MRKINFLLILTLVVVLMGAFVITDQAASAASLTDGPKLTKGMQGERVLLLQQKLSQLGYVFGQVDGSYGNATANAVKRFQRNNGLAADGVAGYQTLQALERGNTTTSRGGSFTGRAGYSQDDLMLLARLIHAEARGESYQGQVAVGAVTLNRVGAAGYPRTLEGVIYQPRQYDAVYDGQINLYPNSTAIAAAREALAGYDPTGGALFYYNPYTSTSRWIFSRPIITQIGNHVFAR